MERDERAGGVRRPKDAIATLTTEERAYIAGLVDRDGAIYVATMGSVRWCSLQPVVTVASSERELIDWLVTRTGSGVTSLDAPTPLRARPAFRSKVYGERAVLLCQVLLPHLRAKAEQARLIAAFPMGDDARRDLHLADGAIDRQRLYVRDAIYALNHPPNATEAEERGEDSTLPRSA